MFNDPDMLTSADWQNIHNWLTFLWIFFPLVITFAFTMLTAHAFIPSLIMTGHLPENASRVRLPMTIFALVVAAVAAVLFGLAISTTVGFGGFWDRWFI